MAALFRGSSGSSCRLGVFTRHRLWWPAPARARAAVPVWCASASSSAGGGRLGPAEQHALLNGYVKKLLLKVHPDVWDGDRAKQQTNSASVATLNSLLRYARDLQGDKPPDATLSFFHRASGGQEEEKDVVRETKTKFFLGGQDGDAARRYVYRRVVYLLEKLDVLVDVDAVASLRQQWREADHAPADKTPVVGRPLRQAAYVAEDVFDAATGQARQQFVRAEPRRRRASMSRRQMERHVRDAMASLERAEGERQLPEERRTLELLVSEDRVRCHRSLTAGQRAYATASLCEAMKRAAPHVGGFHAWREFVFFVTANTTGDVELRDETRVLMPWAATADNLLAAMQPYLELIQETRKSVNGGDLT